MEGTSSILGANAFVQEPFTTPVYRIILGGSGFRLCLTE